MSLEKKYVEPGAKVIVRMAGEPDRYATVVSFNLQATRDVRRSLTARELPLVGRVFEVEFRNGRRSLFNESWLVQDTPRNRGECPKSCPCHCHNK